MKIKLNTNAITEEQALHWLRQFWKQEATVEVVNEARKRINEKETEFITKKDIPLMFQAETYFPLLKAMKIG